MEIIEIDVAPLLFAVEEALKFAYFTVVGIAFLAAVYMMGVLLLALWEGRED